MSTFAIFDLHGYPVDKFKALLDKAGFSDTDTLYVLGDVIDRSGDGGVGVLRWLMEQDNAQLVLGNHEAMLLSCDFVFDEITDESIGNLSDEKLELLQNYMLNGGMFTLQAFRALGREEQNDILDYLRDCPLFEAVTAGDRDFILVHAGLQNFRKDRRLSDYTADELIWTAPAPDETYFEEVHTVFGHTPTKRYGDAYDGKIYSTDTWTCIDAGAVLGNPPVLLCLDNWETFTGEK
jgi:serine/threonine protein phosphatase 1